MTLNQNIGKQFRIKVTSQKTGNEVFSETVELKLVNDKLIALESNRVHVDVKLEEN